MASNFAMWNLVLIVGAAIVLTIVIVGVVFLVRGSRNKHDRSV